MSLKEKLNKILFKQSEVYIISTKRDVTMLVLTFLVILISLFNYRLIFLDIVAILGYYFMPKYSYDDVGIWKIIGKKKRLWFSWKEVKEIDLNGDNLYFLLRNDKIVKIDGVRDSYKVFMALKNKI